jgi:hypothetical protein
MSQGRVVHTWYEWLVIIAILVPLGVVIVAIMAALFLLASPFIVVYWLVLRLLIEIRWGAQGKRILLVYSRSPVWQQYIEATWLPRIGDHVVILNWSDRSQWRRSRTLAALAFRYWAPRSNFNPMAILFPAFLGTRHIGFYDAFRDWKHGNSTKLQQAEAELFSFADAHGG